jgi:hypothetical protein
VAKSSIGAVPTTNPFSMILSDEQHKIHLLGLGSWDPAANVHMTAYDKQLKDFTAMFDKEAIL